MSGQAHVSVSLGEGSRSACSVYEDEAPVLDVATGSAFLLLSTTDRHAVTDADVAAARGLLVAVRRYALDMDRVRIEQRARSGAEAVA